MISKKEFDNYCTNKSIVVVGNSRKILEKENGEFIDSHDIVLRFNRGLPEGYEKHIGTKTDIWAINGRKKETQKILHLKFQDRKYTLWTFYKIGRLNPTLKYNTYHIPLDFYFKTCQDLNPTVEIIKKDLFFKDNMKGKRPTSGCVALYYLIKNIQYKSITVTGFDFLQSFQFHSNDPIHLEKTHSGAKEKEFLTPLLENSRDINWLKL